MDLLTDLQILRDLFDASKRGIPVYIVLDELGAPHFMDMCGRMQVGIKELQVHTLLTLHNTALVFREEKLYSDSR